MRKTEIKAVLFDMDGVIFDTEAVWKKAFFKSNEKFGLNLSEDYRQKEMAGRQEVDIRQKMKLEFPNVDIDAYRDYMLNLVLEEIKTSKKLLMTRSCMFWRIFPSALRRARSLRSLALPDPASPPCCAAPPC